MRNKEDKDNKSKKNYTQREFTYRSFSRSFRLPKGKVKDNEITAEYNNGILNVTLPKVEEAKPQPKRLVEIA